MCRDLYNRNIAKPIVKIRATPRTVPAINPVFSPEELLSGDDKDEGVPRTVPTIIPVVVPGELLSVDDGDAEVPNKVPTIVLVGLPDEKLSGDNGDIDMTRRKLDRFLTENTLPVLNSL